MRRSFRVLLTERCNASCPTCFNKKHRKLRDMDSDDFKKTCDYLAKEGHIKYLKVMGGEPTIHPDFLELMAYAQERFERIFIFSNGINNILSELEFRDEDAVIYNLSCLHMNYSLDKFALNRKGRRLFEVQVSSDSDVDQIIQNLSMVKENVPIDRMDVALTLNCVENIFEKRETIIRKWNRVKDYLDENFDIKHKIDHNIPMCFFKNTDMKIEETDTKCRLACTGLIDTELTLFHCNQLPMKIMPIMKNEAFVDFRLIEKELEASNQAKYESNAAKSCGNCELFGKTCNGGCFIHKDMFDNENYGFVLNNKINNI